MTRNKNIDKKQLKKTAGKCRICGEPEYAVLDVHRIVPGQVGGKYKENNSVVLCANCHRRVHATGEIEIDRYYPSTGGYLLRIVENGEEKFV
jgi:5-methylcytosine-specific restriction endonuclease McrA